MRAGNGDGKLRVVDEIRQQLRAMPHGNSQLFRPGVLRVRAGNCRAENDGVGLRPQHFEVFFVVSDGAEYSGCAQAVEEGGLIGVRAGNFVSARCQNKRQRAHADAADSNEMDAARVVVSAIKKRIGKCV